MTLPTVRQFEMEGLLNTVDNLESLVEPFAEDEIEGIVKHMKSDKAPGPDGFNEMFLKKC